MMVRVDFRRLKNGEPFGVTHSHLFRLEAQISGDAELGITEASGQIPIEEWQKFLENGDPEIPGSGWGPIQIIAHDWLEPPTGWKTVASTSDAHEQMR